MTFRELRAHMGMTQKEMGERLGVTPQMIGQWERSERTPSATTLTALVKEFRSIRVTITPKGMEFFPGEEIPRQRTLLMNSAMMPTPGTYELERMAKKEFIAAVRSADNLHSYIGYRQNAELVSSWTGRDIPVNRSQTDIRQGDRMLIMKLKYRADTGTKGKEVGEDDFEFLTCSYSG